MWWPKFQCQVYGSEVLDVHYCSLSSSYWDSSLSKWSYSTFCSHISICWLLQSVPPSLIRAQSAFWNVSSFVPVPLVLSPAQSVSPVWILNNHGVDWVSYTPVCFRFKHGMKNRHMLTNCLMNKKAWKVDYKTQLKRESYKSFSSISK